LERLPCSCIRTSASRDELQAMGEADLRAYLQRCEGQLEDLQKQKAYEASAAEAQQERLQGNLEDLNRTLNNQLERSRQKANETAMESARLSQEAHALQVKRGQLDTAYSEAFTAWYLLSAELSQKMARLHSCNCKAASLLSRGRQLGKLSPDKKTMYDLLAKVQKCEAVSEVLSGDIEEHQSQERAAVVKASDDMGVLKRKMAEADRLARLSSRGKVVAELRSGRDVLKSAVDTTQAQVSDYAARNAALRNQSAALEEELRRCSC